MSLAFYPVICVVSVAVRSQERIGARCRERHSLQRRRGIDKDTRKRVAGVEIMRVTP